MRRTEEGFSLVEVMVVSAITLLTVGVAAPTITSAVRSYGIDAAAQSVATTVRNARYLAVSRNVSLRVRFNCPVANQMRVVEITGTPAIDNAGNRCDTAAYPYPAPDLDPTTVPNNDGPVLSMARAMSFGGTTDFTISTIGRITPVAGALPTTIAVGDSYAIRNLTVSGSGQVTLSQGTYAR
jgi:type II secretory pathway pseudopilin PulG